MIYLRYDCTRKCWYEIDVKEFEQAFNHGIKVKACVLYLEN